MGVPMNRSGSENSFGQAEAVTSTASTGGASRAGNAPPVADRRYKPLRPAQSSGSPETLGTEQTRSGRLSSQTIRDHKSVPALAPTLHPWPESTGPQPEPAELDWSFQPLQIPDLSDFYASSTPVANPVYPPRHTERGAHSSSGKNFVLYAGVIGVAVVVLALVMAGVLLL